MLFAAASEQPRKPVFDSNGKYATCGGASFHSCRKRRRARAALRCEANGRRTIFPFPRDAGGPQRGAGARESFAAGVVRPAGYGGAEVVEGWAAEARNYDYGSNKCNGMCGHDTQIVWGDTKEVGCAAARGGGREAWVCEYDPPGNWVGKRPY